LPDAPVLEDSDPICHAERFLPIVRHHDRGGTRLLLEPSDLFAYVTA
jgi:hypothetical protein